MSDERYKVTFWLDERRQNVHILRHSYTLEVDAATAEMLRDRSEPEEIACFLKSNVEKAHHLDSWVEEECSELDSFVQWAELEREFQGENGLEAETEELEVPYV